jgi:hypothetical protein
LAELESASLLPEKIETLIYKGSYPKAHAESVSVDRLYSNYLRLYVERDVRQIKNVSDLNVFQKFMRLCAGRIGQLLNINSLSGDCGVNAATVKAWLSLLEASYVIVLLHPYYENFGRRLTKGPKLYFLDTGIACSLLKIRSAQELSEHYLRGGLVESLIITDFLKQQYNLEQQPSVYFWRDAAGHELDCIIDDARYPVPVEIKSSQTVTTDFFKELKFWHKKTGQPKDAPKYLVYGGSEDHHWPDADVISWRHAGNVIKKLQE